VDKDRDYQRRSYWQYAAVLAAWLIYGGLAVFAPAGTTPRVDYHLHFGVLNAIRISILFPILMVWVVAVYGASAINRYSRLLGDGVEGRAMLLISRAQYLTIGVFVISAIFGSALNFYTTSFGYDGLVILRDHLSMLITLAAFAMFYRASLMLTRLVHLRFATTTTVITTVALAALGIWYGVVFLGDHVAANVATGSSVAFVPHGILLITLVLPYFISWYLALLAGINIFRYARGVKGVIYRQSLRSMAFGLYAVVLFSALGGVIMLLANTVSYLSLGAVLGILYAALVLYGVGYIFVASGARKLSKIERA
jgi:hypothetical protein